MRKNLKKARRAAGMTQKETAEYLGITTRNYQRIESGELLGSISNWDALEDLFKVHQRELRMEQSSPGYGDKNEYQNHRMTDEDVLRYLYLVERRLELLDAGVDWKPEYEAELEAVNQELKELRGLVEQEHERRTKNETRDY